MPIANSKGYSLLEIQLITGRTHQIRAHLASIGHPIIGDIKYGHRKTNEFLDKYMDWKVSFFIAINWYFMG